MVPGTGTIERGTKETGATRADAMATDAVGTYATVADMVMTDKYPWDGCDPNDITVMDTIASTDLTGKDQQELAW